MHLTAPSHWSPSIGTGGRDASERTVTIVGMRSVSTAILLGAFLIQGLVPGPPMLSPEAKGGHLALTFSFVWIIVVSNIITTAACFLFLGKIARITQVRSTLVIPFILLLSYLGAFAENNAFGDVVVMLAFGALGWVMVQADWPRLP